MLPEHIKSLKKLLEYFPTEESCLKYLEWVRWNGVVISPFDEKSKVYTCKNGKYFCKNSRKYFTVRTGSIYEKTKIPLRDWFVGIWLMMSAKKGVSAPQLMDHLDVSYPTAWALGQKIRQLLGMELEERISGVFELDEACFGGLQVNRHADKKIPNSAGGHGIDKTWVLGGTQRSGILFAYAMQSRCPECAQPIIRKIIEPGSVIVTDAWKGYNGLDEYRHFVVKDGKHSYHYNPEVHTNSIEGAWSIMKRGYNGIYNWWSAKYFQHYLDEFVFRYNTRKLETRQRFSVFLSKTFRRKTHRDIKLSAPAWT